MLKRRKELKPIPFEPEFGESYIRSVVRRFRRHKLGMASLILLAVIILAAIAGPFLSPYGETARVGGFKQPPSAQNWLGTDLNGRDVLTRLLYGTRVSLLVGFMVTLMSTTIGVTLGLLSGYFGSFADIVIMRVTDMVMSFPYILLVLMAAAVFEPGLWNIILILGFVDWPGVARLVRGNVLSIKEKPYIKRTIVQGLPHRHLLIAEILPNTVAPILIHATSVMAFSILDETALSYLGLGVAPPAASLGNLLGEAKNATVLTRLPWIWMPSGIMIILTVMAINFIGDALRDAVDPTSSRA